MDGEPISRFEIAAPPRIVFGAGVAAEIPELVRSLGSRALFVTGSRPERHELIVSGIRAVCDAVTVFSVTGEPGVETVRGGLDALRALGADIVVAIGGGSVLDAGKAIGALAGAGAPVETYLEVVGMGRAIERAGVPCVAVPTTAGTGAEATRNAVLGVADRRVKVSLRSPFVLPRVAVIDPLLTAGMAPALTASTGLDALTQLIEASVCGRSNPVVDAWCTEGLQRVSRSLREAFDNAGNLDARADLSLASLLSGLSLANAGLGAVHGFAGPIGGMYPIAHGAVCAALLPVVMEANLKAITERFPHHRAIGRYERIARLLTGDSQASALDGIAWVRALCAGMRIRSLGELGVKRDEFSVIAQKASVSSSMKANPIKLDHEELVQILNAAWE